METKQYDVKVQSCFWYSVRVLGLIYANNKSVKGAS